MEQSRIYPEKVTNPIQLMAAWFVMLVILDGSLITGASLIKSPLWISGFLCISAVALAVIVMLAVFLMLTVFRPHLQGAKEYADWLKDKQKYVGRKQETRAKATEIISMISVPKDSIEHTEKLSRINFTLFKEIVSHPVEVSNIDGAAQVVGALQNMGFRAQIYHRLHERQDSQDKPNEYEAIWVGNRVPAKVALLAIKTALKYWGHLKYMALSSEEAPDYVHSEIYIGGATSTAKSDGLREWSLDELKGIDDDISTLDFHKLIISKYPEEVEKSGK